MSHRLEGHRGLIATAEGPRRIRGGYTKALTLEQVREKDVPLARRITKRGQSMRLRAYIRKRCEAHDRTGEETRSKNRRTRSKQTRGRGSHHLNPRRGWGKSWGS